MNTKPYIIHECSDFFIIYKPSGWNTQEPDARTKINYPSVQKYILNLYAGCYLLPRLGMIHRLDRDTTGLLIWAKTLSAYLEFTHMFRARKVYKEYSCIVYGIIKYQQGYITGYLNYKYPNKVYLTQKALSYKSKWSFSRYYLIDTIKDKYSLLRVIIDTGRTHQIRAHMQSINHPLLGDYRYGSSRHIYTPRLLLHSKCIGFIYNELTYYFNTCYPSDFLIYYENTDL